MKTVREWIECAYYDLTTEFGGSGAGIYELEEALKVLDNSREVTEKVTTTFHCKSCAARDAAATWECPVHGRDSRQIRVTSHKARVVLDA